MYIILQIPIVDLRLATGLPEVKLSNPSWPLPKLNKKPFIRHFGNVQKREKGGVEEWVGEEFFCNAAKALQYTDLQKQSFPLQDGKYARLKPIFKRFYADGNFVNKLEFGLKDNSHYKAISGDQQIELTPLLKHYLQLPVRVDKPRVNQTPIDKPPINQAPVDKSRVTQPRVDKTSTLLYKAGAALSSLYYSSTQPHIAGKQDLSRFVQDGEICLLAILRRSQKYLLPGEAKLVSTFPLDGESEPIRLHAYTLHLDGVYIKSWIIEIPESGFRSDSPAGAILRNLRINLMRVHAEKETIKSLLNAVQYKLLDLDSPTVNTTAIADYLKDASEKIFTKKRYGIDQETILDFALRSEKEISPDKTVEVLVQKLNNKFIDKSVQKFVDKSTPVDKKRILFLCSSPQDKAMLNFGEELSVIRRLHSSSIDRANYEILPVTGVEADEVTEVLSQYKPDILHISLHASKSLGLYFEDVNKNAVPVGIDEWTSIIQLQALLHKPEIIILSACNSFDYAAAVKQFTDFAAGTKNVFPDSASIAYARGFYTVLFNDNKTNLETCHLAGINAIKFNKNPRFQPINGVNVDEIMCMC